MSELAEAGRAGGYADEPDPCWRSVVCGLIFLMCLALRRLTAWT